MGLDPAWIERGLVALAMGAGSYFGRLKRRSRLESRLDAQDDDLSSVLRKLVRLRDDLEARGLLTPSPIGAKPKPLSREPKTEGAQVVEGVARPPVRK